MDDPHDGYTAITESDEKGGASWKKHASPESGQQNEGRDVSGTRYATSASANRSRSSKGRTNPTQNTKPDGYTESKGRELGG